MFRETVQKHGGKCILLILQFDIRIGIHFDDSSFPLRFTKEARYEMAGFNFPQLGLRLPHLPVANRQRLANRHSGSGSMGEVSSPVIKIRSLRLWMLGTGMAESSAWV